MTNFYTCTVSGHRDANAKFEISCPATPTPPTQATPAPTCFRLRRPRRRPRFNSADPGANPVSDSPTPSPTSSPTPPTQTTRANPVADLQTPSPTPPPPTPASRPVADHELQRPQPRVCYYENYASGAAWRITARQRRRCALLNLDATLCDIIVYFVDVCTPGIHTHRKIEGTSPREYVVPMTNANTTRPVRSSDPSNYRQDSTKTQLSIGPSCCTSPSTTTLNTTIPDAFARPLAAQTQGQVVVAIGGWSFKWRGVHCADAAEYNSRGLLIDSVIEMLNYYQLDGIDWDIEYPGSTHDTVETLRNNAEARTVSRHFEERKPLQTSLRLLGHVAHGHGGRF